MSTSPKASRVVCLCTFTIQSLASLKPKKHSSVLCLVSCVVGFVSRIVGRDREKAVFLKNDWLKTACYSRVYHV